MTGSITHEGLLNTQQTMERMGLSQSQLARLRESRKMSYYRRAGRIFYTPSEVERVLKSFEVPAITEAQKQEAAR